MFSEIVIPNAEFRKREIQQGVGTSPEKSQLIPLALLHVNAFGCLSFSLPVVRIAPWNCALISSVSLCWSPVIRQSGKNVGCHFLARDLRILSFSFFIYEIWIMTGVHVSIHVYVCMCVCLCVFRSTRPRSEQHPATSFFFFYKQYVLEIFPCQYIKLCHMYSALWLHHKFI